MDDLFGEEDNGNKAEQRLLIMDRSGSGNVYLILLSEESGIVDPSCIDLYTEKWEQIYMLRDFGVCFHDDYMYIVGGYSQQSNSYSDAIVRYDTVHDIWQDLPPMFHARSNFGTIYCNGKIYITGGVRSNGKPTKSCEAFNLTLWSWERVGMLPYARKNHQVATDGKTVYISGGDIFGKVHANVWLSEDYTWNNMDDDYPTTMSTCRTLHMMEYHEGVLYFIAGLTKDKSTGRLDRTTDEPQNTQQQPEKQQQLESKEQQHKPCQNPIIDSSMESFMPVVTTSVLDDTNFISPWDWGLPPLKHARVSAGSIVLGNKLYVIGGTGADNKIVSRTEVYDFQTRHWKDDFIISNCNISNVACMKISCRSDRRKQHSPETSHLWSRYKWIMW